MIDHQLVALHIADFRTAHILGLVDRDVGGMLVALHIADFRTAHILGLVDRTVGGMLVALHVASFRTAHILGLVDRDVGGMLVALHVAHFWTATYGCWDAGCAPCCPSDCENPGAGVADVPAKILGLENCSQQGDEVDARRSDEMNSTAVFLP